MRPAGGGNKNIRLPVRLGTDAFGSSVAGGHYSANCKCLSPFSKGCIGLGSDQDTRDWHQRHAGATNGDILMTASCAPPESESRPSAEKKRRALIHLAVANTINLKGNMRC